MKRIILALALIILLASAWYGYRIYTGKVKSLTVVKPDVSLSASELVEAFKTDSSGANKRYLGKIILLTGNLKAVEPESSTIVLGDKDSDWSVRCSMDSAFVNAAASFKPGNSLRIKGNCTGYLAGDFGLGSDIILNRCVIESNGALDH
jgi:hypothetical protein